MYTYIERLALAMQSELTEIRRELHKIPETSFEEYKTCEYIRRKLSEYSIPFETVVNTGTVALIKGSTDGKTILLRADIDGLPIKEENNIDYRSEHDGYMHACGHDVHTACLLGAAKILNSIKDRIKGNIKLVFQPAEEGSGGALPMIQNGVMENPTVDAAIGMHVEPLEQTGNIQVKNGSIMASPDEFYITVHGVGGHGAYPNKCVDPILVGSMIISAYQTIVSRHIDPMIPCAVSVCTFHAGDCVNVIPDTAYITGTARALDLETRNKIAHLLKKIAVQAAESMGASVDFEFKYLFPPLINAQQITDIIRMTGKRSSLVKNITELENASMAGDDFAYFAQRVPSSYFKLGVGNKDKNCIYPIHSSHFNADENALPVGVSVLVLSALEYLGGLQ